MSISLSFVRVLRTLSACGFVSVAGIMLHAEGSADPEIATLRIDAARSPGPVNRLVLGHNIEAADAFGIFINTPGSSNDGQGLWDAVARDVSAPLFDKVLNLGVGALRYPGGCLAHNFDWKAAVGPLEDRPNFQFGVDEYLRLCVRLNAEPVFIVSDYRGTAQDAADLVEYLNAPATPDHPWAMKRKEWGREAPYGVKWFELGNESDHGNHDVTPFKRFTPDDYVVYARSYARAMKAVDPSIQVGIVSVPGNATNIDLPWNRAVFKGAGDIADFVVLHFYTPNISDDPERQVQAQMSCLAVGDQLPRRLAQYRELIRAESGRDLPLAITEYNVGAARQQHPIPYRFSFVGALFAADFIRIGLEPENHVVMANYWHVVNGYWSMLNTMPGRPPERPAYPLYKLWGSHLGSRLASLTIESPSASFGGAPAVSPAFGDAYQPRRLLGSVAIPAKFDLHTSSDATHYRERTRDGALRITFEAHTGKAYPVLFTLPAPTDHGVAGVEYRLTFEGRVYSSNGDPAADFGTFGLGMVDPRGWDATASAVAVTGVENKAGWHRLSGTLHALPDASGVSVLARFEVKKPITGSMEIRDIQVEAFSQEVFPEYPLLTGTASLSEDGETLYLIVFNKSLDRAISARLILENFAAIAGSFEQVANAPDAVLASSATAGDLAPVDRGQPVLHTFPPCSMTAFKFTRISR